VISHLFDDWPAVIRRLRASRAIALFLDFDGTLARLRPRPDQVLLHGSVRRVLAVLARCPRFRSCVITGRRLDDVRSRIRVPRIHYLGLHGWEGHGEGLSEDTVRAIPRLRSDISVAMAEVPGIWVEDKKYAFSVHFRGVAQTDVRRAYSLLRAIVTPSSRRFRVKKANKVWEVLPRELGDKGIAVRRQLDLLPDPATPIYVGDDPVDEPAFAALPDGVTVRVGRNTLTRARYRLRNVAEVSTFLHKLKEEFA